MYYHAMNKDAEVTPEIFADDLMNSVEEYTNIKGDAARWLFDDFKLATSEFAERVKDDAQNPNSKDIIIDEDSLDGMIRELMPRLAMELVDRFELSLEDERLVDLNDEFRMIIIEAIRNADITEAAV